MGHADRVTLREPTTWLFGESYLLKFDTMADTIHHAIVGTVGGGGTVASGTIAGLPEEDVVLWLVLATATGAMSSGGLWWYHSDRSR